ncbi:RIO1 family protein [Cryptosporidium andersoni]|uniref:non-specific serine/threonine protein kinase n=1 Tax=Cryptosporidium andersoni TaxID=117008 RepID=A0A1J4MV40_9CRYT|nr:RIO1 family protein [Cryptosporidium andersoni]
MNKSISKSLAYDVIPSEICKMNQNVQNEAKASDEKGQKHRPRGLTRDTRATIMQVLDARTLNILKKLQNRGIYSKLYGTISTGKEANVYKATSTLEDILNYGKYLEDRNHLTYNEYELLEKLKEFNLTHVDRAIKVFKTSVLSFKDRSKYIEGEFRFRRGYSKSKNPRKMVTQWCEKEFRNLRRILVSGIRCPIPIEVGKHILVMSLIGDITQTKDIVDESEFANGNYISTFTKVVAPRLKDAPLDIGEREWIRLYVEMIGIIFIMFTECHLIHGDMSEYNILYYKGHLYVIDVSQSMEHDHPLGLEFLKRDCINVTEFFSKVFQSKKFTNTCTYSEYNIKTEGNNIALELSQCLFLTNFSATSLLLTPLELYNIILSGKIQDLAIISEIPEDLKDIDKIILDILEVKDNQFIWPYNDLMERQLSLYTSFQPYQESSILDKANNVQKTYLLLLRYLVTRCFNQRNSIETNLSNLHLESQETEYEKSVFLETWIPYNLSQINDRKTLEKELDRKERGEDLLYGHLLPNPKDSTSQSSEYSECFSNSDESDTSEISSLSNLSKLSERFLDRDSSENGSSSNLQGDLKHQAKFDGCIPTGMSRKEWKQRVKEENRLKRINKVPKYIKQKKKKQRKKTQQKKK